MLPDTPSILVDVDRLENNIRKMAELARKNNVALRPHIKTHKTVEIARMQLAAGASGITVAKVSEAEIMVQAGIDDIFIAYPIIGAVKLRRLLDLNRRCRLIVGVDSLAGASAMAESARNAGQEIAVRLEVDIGFARTGVAREEMVNLAVAISQMDGLKLEGIFAFKAMTLAGKPTTDRQAAGLEEGKLAVDLADLIRSAGVNIITVSIGSTPTAEFAATVPGVTEIRPGTYVFNDMATVQSGTCTLDDCAAFVLVTIVSKNAGRLVIDGGSKTFSTDSQPDKAPLNLTGFGRILEDDRLVLSRFTEEHGMITVLDGAKDWQIGDQLRIVPNHICTTVNLHDTLMFVRDGQMIRTLRIDARGCVT
jgi:D-serine deaminase-like pyridoxal phosphate-dependent protein